MKNLKVVLFILILSAFTACFSFPNSWGEYFTTFLAMIVFWVCMLAAAFNLSK